jgi:hypothetical protein
MSALIVILESKVPSVRTVTAPFDPESESGWGNTLVEIAPPELLMVHMNQGQSLLLDCQKEGPDTLFPDNFFWIWRCEEDFLRDLTGTRLARKILECSADKSECCCGGSK